MLFFLVLIFCGFLGMLFMLLLVHLVKRWIDEMYKKLLEEELILENVTNEQFVRQLAQETGCSYKVLHNINETYGICDYKEKKIVLTYTPDSSSLWALFQAGHEIGHAYKGPGCIIKYRVPVSLFIFLLFLSPVFAALANLPNNLAYIVNTLVCVIIAVLFYVRFKSEIEASIFAKEKLMPKIKIENHVAKLKERLKLDIFYNALENVGYLIVLSLSVWLLYLMFRFYLIFRVVTKG